MNGYQFDLDIALGKDLSLTPQLPGLPPHSASLIPFVLAGVDEAGRGPLAGPVVAAAVILPVSPQIEGLRDSKVVPVEQREALYCEIVETAIAWEVIAVEAHVIDAVNIFAACMQAMRQAINGLSVKPHLIIIDGNQCPGSGCPERAIIKGDSKSAAVMAASIIAKVTRDRIMEEFHEQYPHYGFDEHKGYGCKKHIDALRRHGPSPIHRMSFEPVRSVATQPATLL